MNKYKLNIRCKNALGYNVGEEYRLLCNEAYNYINKFTSFKEAYENCTKGLYLQQLMSYINLLDHNNRLNNFPYFIGQKIKKYNKDSKIKYEFLNDDIRLVIFSYWERQYTEGIKSQYNWEDIEKKLIENEILIENKGD